MQANDVDKVYIDSSFFVSLVFKDDSNNNRAEEIYNKLLIQRIVFYSSYYTIDESATVISIKKSKAEAISFLETFYDSNPPIILDLDKKLREKSYTLFKQIKSKNVSMVDCHSMTLMKENGIKKCLTFDQHFQKLGFKTIR